jgi:RNA polymerase sigma factor (sigma-70 family)
MPPPAEGFAARFVIGPALRAQPDRRLVTLVREGYENAFEEIVRRYGKPLTRYAAAIVGGRAEDVTQDAFSKALLALRRDGNEIELRPWLFRIVRNTALNELRDSPPSAEALAEVIASGASPAEELERREELADLMRRLQSLPEAQRAAIVMRELEGLSHEEIASALGLSDGGARQAIYRARRSLRDGAGMLLPLPLLKALLTSAASAPVEAAAGAAGVGGAAGAGVALKAAAATVLVAGAVGAGVAIDHTHHPRHPQQAWTSREVADEPATPVATSTGNGQVTDDRSTSGDTRQGGEPKPRDDHGRDGSGGSGSSDDHSGHGSGGDRGSGTSEGGGNRGPSGHGGGRPEPGDDHGGGPGPSEHDGSGSDNGSERHSGRGSSDSSGSSGASSDSSGGPSGGGGGSDDNSGSGSGPGPSPSGESDLGSGSGGGSGSSGGPGPSSDGSSGGGDQSTSGGSGDSHGGGGFSVQKEPQTEEEP